MSPLARRIRVALVAYRDDPSAGGSLRVAETLAQHLPRGDVEAHLVLAYGRPGATAARAGVPVHCLQARSSTHWPAWLRARASLRRMHFDVIHFVDHVHWIYAATWGLPARRVVHFHGRPALHAYSWRHRLLSALHRVGTDAAIAISHGARRAVCRAGSLAAPRVHVVHNAVNLGYFSDLPSQEEARDALGLPQAGHLFGQVARLVDGNACLEILDLLRHLPETWHGVLVGEGPLRPVLQERARQWGLAPRLHFTGGMEDVRPAYAALDLVVLLSRYQPFCLMLAEAMASRVPIVGLHGAGEYAEPEYPLVTAENSRFVRRQHPQDFASTEPDETYAKLAQAMIALMADDNRRRAQIDNAHAWVAARFAGESQGRACLETYRHILRKERACG